jgi:hypothetical protein
VSSGDRKKWEEAVCASKFPGKFLILAPAFIVAKGHNCTEPLAKAADVEAKLPNGVNAIQMAELKGYVSIIKLLREANRE